MAKTDWSRYSQSLYFHMQIVGLWSHWSLDSCYSNFLLFSPFMNISVVCTCFSVLLVFFCLLFFVIHLSFCSFRCMYMIFVWMSVCILHALTLVCRVFSSAHQLAGSLQCKKQEFFSSPHLFLQFLLGKYTETAETTFFILGGH